MKNIFFVTVVFFFNIFFKLASAQEIQIPVNAEGKIEYIDSKLEQKLNLFSDYENFKEARLFQISDTLFVLEVYYKPKERILKNRLLVSQEEVAEFQQTVTDKIKQKAPQVALNQTGRTRLIVGNLALAMGYYGWALPVALDINDDKLAVALYMLTSSAGFFIPFSATKNRPVSAASSNLSLYGGTRGIAHGITLSYLFSKNPSHRATVGAGMLISISESIMGFVIAKNSKMSAGTAQVTQVGGDFGIGLGLGSAHLAHFFENNEQSAAAITLLGSGMGLFAGKLLANNQHYTKGDAHVLSALGLLGAYIPLALVDMVAPDEDRAYTAASMAGAILGLGLGHRLLMTKDFSTDQGNFVRLSELAGGLLGLGFAYLISSENVDNSTLYLTASSIGATAGFWAMYRSYARGTQTSNNRYGGNFRITPEGLLALAVGDRIDHTRSPIPLIRFTYNF